MANIAIRSMSNDLALGIRETVRRHIGRRWPGFRSSPAPPERPSRRAVCGSLHRFALFASTIPPNLIDTCADREPQYLSSRKGQDRGLLCCPPQGTTHGFSLICLVNSSCIDNAACPVVLLLVPRLMQCDSFWEWAMKTSPRTITLPRSDSNRSCRLSLHVSRKSPGSEITGRPRSRWGVQSTSLRQYSRDSQL